MKKTAYSLIALLFILVIATIGCTRGHESIEGICEDAKENTRYRVDHRDNVGIVVGIVTQAELSITATERP